MKSNIDELIIEIDSKLQIAITISALFPVVLSTYFQIIGDKSGNQDTAFIYFSILGLYLASYIIFQVLKLISKTSKLILSILNAGLIAGIACYVMPIGFIVISSYNSTQPINLITITDALFFIISMYGMFTIALGISIYITIVSLLAGSTGYWGYNE